VTRQGASPTIAERLLALLLAEDLHDAVFGDLAEERLRREAAHGEAAARRWHRSQVCRSLLPALFHRLTTRPRRHRAMHTIVEARLQDARFGVRSLRRSPGFSLAAVGVLALGIGAATAVFTVVEDVLLRPLPYPAAERIHFLSQDGDDGSYWLSEPNFRDMQTTLGSFEQLSAFTWGGSNLLVDGRPERISVAEVDGEFFGTLGLTPALGRTFDEQERRAGASVVVIGHGLWQRLLAGSADAVGKQLVLDGKPREVIGVLPRGPALPASVEA
jgi:putative ABC transport system permease protein